MFSSPQLQLFVSSVLGVLSFNYLALQFDFFFSFVSMTVICQNMEAPQMLTQKQSIPATILKLRKSFLKMH